jgi:tetratricopeptide (TPR) repeat protein
MEGTQAEYAGRHDQARTLYWRAWQAAKDDYDLCIAAHYVARFQIEPEKIFHWNLEALTHANLVKDERVKEFYPSLYLNMGRSYELLGNQKEAKRYYDLAAGLGYEHQLE